MRNKDVVESFVRREINSNLHLTSTGDRLISYRTCIAQWKSSTLYVNRTKYSTATSRHLGLLLRRLSNVVKIINMWNIKQDSAWLKELS